MWFGLGFEFDFVLYIKSVDNFVQQDVVFGIFYLNRLMGCGRCGFLGLGCRGLGFGCFFVQVVDFVGYLGVVGDLFVDQWQVQYDVGFCILGYWVVVVDVFDVVVVMGVV